MPQLNFTVRALDALSAPRAGERAVYHDTKQRGLQLRVAHGGVKTFSVLRRPKGGRPERVTIGRYDNGDKTIEQARRDAEELGGQFAKGESPALVRRTKRGEITLGDVFNEYLADARVKRKRPDKLESTWRLYLEQWKARQLSQITPTELARWHRKLPEQIQARREAIRATVADMASLPRRQRVKLPNGVNGRVVDGKRSANIALKQLHAIYEFAIKRRLWEGSNPATGIETFDESERERFLQPDEITRFFEALAAVRNTAVRDFFLLALLTGARRGNVLAMRWADLNLTEGLWTIPGEFSKNGDPLRVALAPEVLAILNARAAAVDSAFVLPSAGKRGHLVAVDAAWRELVASVGLKDLRIHDLRRTLGSWQARAGASLAIIGRSLGHRSVAATRIYARLDHDPVAESVNRATAAIVGAAGKKVGALIPGRKTNGK